MVRHRLAVILAALATALSGGTASAQSEWLNYAGGTWSTGANWTPTGVPTFSSTLQLTFGSTPLNGPPTFLYQPTGGYTASYDGAAGNILNSMIFNGFGAANVASNGIVINPSSIAGASLIFQGTTPTITQNGTGSVTFAANATATTELLINNGLTVAGAGIGHITFAGTIGGSGNLNISSTGSSTPLYGQQIFVAPTVANTFTGNIVLNSGHLTLNTTAAVMSAGSTLVINGGTVRASTAFTLPNAVTLNSQLVYTGILGGTFNGVVSGDGGIRLAMTAAVATTFNNTISGTGAIVVEGFGSQTNQLTLASTTTNGTALNAASYTFNQSALLLSNTTLTATRLNTAAGLTLNGSTLQLTAGTAANAVETVASTTVGGALLLNVLPTTTRAAVFNGGNLIMNGSGYSGTILVTNTTAGTTLGGTVGAAGNATVTFSNLSSVNNANGILPIAYANFLNGTATAFGFVRYDNTNGIVPLNLTTDYTQSNAVSPVAVPKIPTANYRISAPTTTTGTAIGNANGNTSVNALLIETLSAPGPIAGGIYGTGTITLTSGLLGTSLTGGTTQGTLMGVAINKNIVLGTNTVGHFYLATSAVLTGSISGNAGLVKAGPGALTLTGDNSGLTGGLFLNSGQINFTRDANLGAPGEGITLSQGTGVGNFLFNPTNQFGDGTASSVTINRPIAIAGSAALISVVVPNNTLELSGAISGPGRLTKSFLGHLVLSNPNNTYTGDTTILQGTLSVASDGSLGATSGGINFQSTSTGYSAGVLRFSGSLTTNRTVAIQVTTAAANFISTSGASTVVTMNGNIAGNQTGTPFNKIGSGELILTANNAVNGAITFGEATPIARQGTPFSEAGGTTTLSGPNGAFSQGISYTLNIGTTLHLDNTAAVNQNRLASQPVNLSGAEFKLTGNAAASMIEHIGNTSTTGLNNSAFGNTISLTQPASGGSGQSTTLLATGYSTSLANGVAFFRGTNLGDTTGDRTAVIFVTAPTLTNGVLPQAFFAGSATASPQDFASTTATGVGTSVSVTRFTTYAGFVGSGALPTSTYAVAAAATQTASQTMNALKITDSSYELSGTTLTLGAGLLLATGTNSSFTNSTGTGVVAFGSNAARIAVTGTLSIGTAAAPVNVTGSAGLNKFGPGTLELSGTTGITAGGITVAQGTLRYLQTTAFVAQAVTIQPGATLDINNLGTPAAPFGNMTLVGFGTANIGTGALATGFGTGSFGGAFVGSGTLLNTGTGTQSLSGNSPNFSGGVQITNGGYTVESNVVPSDATNPGPLGTSTSPIVFGASAGTNVSVITLGAGVTRFERDIAVTAGGTGGLTFNSAGASTVNITSNINFGTSGRTILLGPSVFAAGSGNLRLSGTISGTGSILQIGGQLAFWGNNSYTGGTIFEGDGNCIIGIGHDNGFGTGTVTFGVNFSDTGTLRADNGARTLANNFRISSTTAEPIGFTGVNNLTLNGTFDLALIAGAVTRTFSVSNQGLTTVNGVVLASTGTSSLVKTGPGTLVLGGANTYTLGTTVSGGVLRLTNTTGSGTGTGAVTINQYGRLEGTGITTSAITLASGGTLSGGNSNVGTLTINAGITFVTGSFIGVGIADGTTPGGLNSGTSSTPVAANNLLDKTGGLAPTGLSLPTLLVDLSGVEFSTLYVPYSYRIGQGMGSTVFSVTAANQFQFYNLGTTYTELSNVSYTGDAGGFLYLNFTPTPEPGVLLGLAGLAGIVALRRRRA